MHVVSHTLCCQGCYYTQIPIHVFSLFTDDEIQQLAKEWADKKRNGIVRFRFDASYLTESKERVFAKPAISHAVHDQSKKNF